MRTFACCINYFFLMVSIIGALGSFIEFNPQALLWSALFVLISIPNLIYIHQTKPIDLEKENLKKEIEDLKKNIPLN